MKDKLKSLIIIIIIILFWITICFFVISSESFETWQKVIVFLCIAILLYWYLFIYSPRKEKWAKELYDQAYKKGFECGCIKGRISESSDSSPDYFRGYQDGRKEEKDLNEREWRQFFDIAQLKNTITGAPINNLQDFYIWKKEFESAKAKRENMQQ